MWQVKSLTSRIVAADLSLQLQFENQTRFKGWKTSVTALYVLQWVARRIDGSIPARLSRYLFMYFVCRFAVLIRLRTRCIGLWRNYYWVYTAITTWGRICYYWRLTFSLPVYSDLDLELRMHCPNTSYNWDSFNLDSHQRAIKDEQWMVEEPSTGEFIRLNHFIRFQKHIDAESN